MAEDALGAFKASLKQPFEEECKKFYDKLQEQRKLSILPYVEYCEIIETIEKWDTLDEKTSLHYKWYKTYDIMYSGAKKYLSLKLQGRDVMTRSRVVYQEELYDILIEAHVQGVNHPTSRTVYKFVSEKYSNISGTFCEILQAVCTTCSLKKRSALSQEVIQPIISEGFMHRMLIDLINMQAYEFNGYKYILVAVDHFSKFLLLRALKDKTAEAVATELIPIFEDKGCPTLLQSDNGAEFVNDVIKALLALWKDAKAVHGRPRYPQSQGMHYTI